MAVQPLTYHQPPFANRQLDGLLRRVFDIVTASLGLVVLSPLMLLIAITVRLDSPGPVLFRQSRLGQHGRRFRLYKFRKFTDGPKANGPAVTLKDDARMTRVGRVLERSKLDELPQLFNILIGDMSVVGPRPETLDFASCFTGRCLAVLDYRPGLFGPSQTIFRNECRLYPPERDPHEFYRNVLFPAKAQIDMQYFSRRTFLSDVGWVLRGVLAIAGFAPTAVALDGLPTNHHRQAAASITADD